MVQVNTLTAKPDNMSSMLESHVERGNWLPVYWGCLWFSTPTQWHVHVCTYIQLPHIKQENVKSKISHSNVKQGTYYLLIFLFRTFNKLISNIKPINLPPTINFYRKCYFICILKNTVSSLILFNVNFIRANAAFPV